MAEYLTAALPGTGGEIRTAAEDFFVEEIPLYEPCGQGDHLYLTVEKTGLTTFDLLKMLARELKCPERDLGYAGLKDARAITRQTISAPLRQPEDVAGLMLPGVKILSARLHTNKLRTGHLAGNRFRIRITGPHAKSLERAERICGVLEDLGVPNRFGSQRYGLLGNSHRIGLAILRGDFAEATREIIGDPAQITHPCWQTAAEAFQKNDLDTAIKRLPRHCQNERRLLESLQRGASHKKSVLGLPRKLLRLYLSAYQSSLFDRLLDMRLGTLEKVWAGDLAYKHINGACFLVDDPAVEQPRADRFEISASAPLYGYKVKLAGGQSGILEQSLLESEQLDLKDFRLTKGLSMEGDRRPLRVPLSVNNLHLDGNDLILSFELPRGSFATAVLAEVMKSETS